MESVNYSTQQSLHLATWDQLAIRLNKKKPIKLQ